MKLNFLATKKWQMLLALSLNMLIFSAYAAIPPSERTQLLAIYNSTVGATWTNNTGWNGLAGTECTWQGVMCDPSGSTVIELDLSSNNLTGTLPSSLSALPNLELFNVSGNSLTGKLPAISNMTKLQIFNADNNSLTGSIWPFTNVPSLYNYSVMNNQLIGGLPSLAGLVAMAPASTGPYLGIAGNKLTGFLPNNLVTGATADVCPNQFIQTPSGLWDAATGTSPWWTSGLSPCLAPAVTSAQSIPSLSTWALCLLASLIAILGSLKSQKRLGTK